ncbi:MAG: hypothetical protein ACRC14_18930 [Paracoccaceae bacterium]
MPLTGAQKEARRRAKKAAAGLVLIRVYVPAHKADAVRKAVAKMLEDET